MSLHFLREQDLSVYGKDGYIVFEDEDGEVIQVSVERFEVIVEMHLELIKEAAGQS